MVLFAAWKSTLSVAVFVHRVLVFAYPRLKVHMTRNFFFLFLVVGYL